MKVKTAFEREQEKKFEQNLAYEEFLRANNPEPNSCELDQMEKVFCKAKILKHTNHIPLNNLHYQPLQGA